MDSATTSFRPSIHGFRFLNTFRADEIMEAMHGVPTWMWPDDTWGLCGGMCFSALDRYFDGATIPDQTSPPDKADLLFQELVRRQSDAVDSVGWSKILDYQLRPDEGSSPSLQPHSLGRYVQQTQWPSVKWKLDSGIPTTICLIRAQRGAVQKIGDNHQVVGWAYSVSSSKEVTVNIYDPNHPSRDDVTIGFTLGQKNSRLDAYQSTGENLRGILRIPYDRTERRIDLVAVAARDDMEWLWTVLDD